MRPEETVERSDPELIASIRAGERAGFDELMRRYERLVYKVVFGLVKRREDALDLTQSSFLKAFQGLDEYRGDASFKTWLLRIAYHEGLNWTRAAGRREPGVELDEAAPRLALVATQERELEARQRLGAVQRALARLNGRYRTTILLRYVDEMSIRDIAAVLACSEAMTKNILFRGVRQLRRAMAEAG
jgi:RNA polymerase sigma-70 factor (ECF subfamily)